MTIIMVIVVGVVIGLVLLGLVVAAVAIFVPRGGSQAEDNAADTQSTADEASSLAAGGFYAPAALATLADDPPERIPEHEAVAPDLDAIPEVSNNDFFDGGGFDDGGFDAGFD